MSSGFTRVSSALPRVRDPRTGARLTNGTATNGAARPANALVPPSPRASDAPRPKWLRRGDGFLLPADHRCKCPDCGGRGTHAWDGLLSQCGFCTQMEGPCITHKCRRCDGSGMVCPRCRGMRFLRVPAPVGAELVRCDSCCEGNQVNIALERRTILRYLNRHPHVDDLTTAG